MKKFEQVKKLYLSMKNNYNSQSFSPIYISAITSDFDRLFELSWKTMKEYLYSDLGIIEAKTGSPKSIIKLAYQENLIHDEKNWLDMLSDRNDDSHIYNESIARSYAARIERDYLNIIHDFIQELSKYIKSEPNVLINIPESFLESCQQSGMYYDEFVKTIISHFSLQNEMELFSKWDEIKDQIFEENDDRLEINEIDLDE